MNTPASHITLFNKLLIWADKTEEKQAVLITMLRKIVRLFLITFTEFNKNNLSLRSGALTYTIMLSLVPMLAMSTAVVKGLGGGDQLREVAYSYIDTLEQKTGNQNNPDEHAEEAAESKTSEPADLTSHLRSAVDQLFDYVDNTNFATLGTVGMVGILLSVLLVLGHIESAMNTIWKVTAGRSILRKIADYLTLLILMPISVNVAFAASAFLESPVLASKMNTFIPAAWAQALLLKPLPIFFIALTFYALYIFFTNTKVKTIPALTGAVLAAILWFGMQNLYVSLQVGVAKYNAIYGSFATLPLFLIWMYLGWMFILTGAQLAFSCQHLNKHRLAPCSNQPSLRLGAAFDIMEDVYDAFSHQKQLTRDEILNSQAPHYPRPLLIQVLEELQQAEFIHFSQKDARILPTNPIELFDDQKVVESILGTQSPPTAGGRKSLDAIKAAGENGHLSKNYNGI